MKKIPGILSVVVLVVGLLSPGIPVLAEDQGGMVQAPAVTSAEPLAGGLDNDIQELRQKADDDGRVTVVIKLEVPSLSGVEKGRVVEELKLQTSQSQERVLGLLNRGDVVILNAFWLANAILAEVPVEMLDAIASLAEVERLFENFTVTIPEPSEEESPVEVLEAIYTWGLEKIRAPEVWDELGATGSGVRVAVLDTGVDISHPDLAGRMWTDNPADPTYPGGWGEFDSSGNIVTGSTPYDSGSHGTHCSGTVLGGDASGTAIGVAPDATLMHGLVLKGSGGTFAQVIAGMQWAMAPVDQYGNPAGEPADVVSMSLGAKGYHSTLIEPVQSMKAAGIVPVIAIGNDGEGESSSPGNVYEAFGIGATSSNDNVASFSSGRVIDWPSSHPEPYIKPDLSAPGVSVYSATPGDGYASWQGTSMATPHVAGTAALILEANPALTVNEVYEILKDTAVWYDRYYDERPCPRYGWGRIDAFEAVYLAALDSGIEGIVTDAETGEPVAGTEILVSETDSVKYTDASGYYRFFSPPGAYTLTAGEFGYYEEIAIVEVEEYAFTWQDFALESMPTGSLAGMVTDLETGAPIEGATITLLDTPLGTTTNEMGQYFIDAPAGGYDIRGWSWGYKAFVVSGVDVPKDETVTVDFSLEPTLTVAVMGDYRSQLTGLLMNNDISAEERGWDIVSDISRYDVVVVNRPSNPGESTFMGFLDAASDNGVGVVFTSSFPVGWAYGITLLQSYLGDPAGQAHNAFGGHVYYQVGDSHPIFEGWDVGETITIITAGDRDHTWFWDYSGYTISDVGQQNVGIRGEAVALNEYGGSLHVLLASLAPTQWTNITHWTEDAKTIFVRAVITAGGLLDTDLVVTTTELPSGVAGTEYQATLEALGGTEPYNWAITGGSLPDEVGLDADTGVISGVPTADGTFDFTVQVTDDIGETATAGLSITIAEPLEIVTTELAGGQAGVAYEAALEASGGTEPYNWAITGGSLPDGLGLDADTGVISGVPTADDTFELTVQVTDSMGGMATADLSIDVEPAAVAEIVGETGEVNSDILAGVTVSLYQDDVLAASTISDENGAYMLTVPEPGDYDVVVSKAGFRSVTLTISVTEPVTYTLDFAGDHGLIPNAPTMSYVLKCMNLRLYGQPPYQLSMSKVLAVMNARLYPISEE